jgi:3-methyladenine DNA glycosylase AlkD
MPATRTQKSSPQAPVAKSAGKSTARPAGKAVAKPVARPVGKPVGRSVGRSVGRPGAKSAPRFSLDEVMAALEKAGTAQARKTYARHGAQEPMFGVSFATLKTLVKRIGVDHELALALWSTKNHDARVLAMKIADPAAIRPADLDRWASENRMRMCGAYVAMLAAESPHAASKAREWLASDAEDLRTSGWALVGRMANLDEETPDDWFAKLLARIEKSIHTAPNYEREAMNAAVIQIGGRSPALRKAATATAKKIGIVEVDHGDTSCKTPEAAPYIAKMWAHSEAKRFDSPAAQERAREPMRTRC